MNKKNNISEITNDLANKEYAEKMYFELRKEIGEKVKRLENLSTFTITTTVTIMGILINFILNENTNGNPLLLLIPIAFIIPVSIRAAANRRDIRKISDYMIETYEKTYIDKENGGWENYSRKKSQEYGTLFNAKHLDFIFSAIVCVSAYLIITWTTGEITWNNVIIAIITLLLVIIPTKALTSTYKCDKK